MTQTCQNCKKEFVIEQEDLNFYERIKVPPPTWCPECRMIRRLVWRNERSLYKRKCDLCGKDIISMYSKEAEFPVYCNDCWWSDKWDAIEYGKDYDFSINFFEQLSDLFKNIPHYNFHVVNSLGCYFINFSLNNKNCYLGASYVGCEDSAYCNYVEYNKNCFDSVYLNNSELCYENIDGLKNFNCIYLLNCKECMNSSFFIKLY